jgi:spore coat polysaccharide biosynthesis protein SpsF
MQTPLIIIQARLSSTRLPGKVIRPFFGDKTILDIQIETIKKHLPNHKLLVATTINPADDELVAICSHLGVEAFRGSEADVLQRFVDCATHHDAENMIRICSDNPFLLAQELVEVAKSGRLGADYVSYKNSEGTPAIKTHWGLFAEFVTRDALQRAAKATTEAVYHEHVTNYIYGHDVAFTVKLKDAPMAIRNRNDLRFTIDTQADFETCQEVYAAWDKQSLTSLINLVDGNTHWLDNMKKGIAQFTK